MSPETTYRDIILKAFESRCKRNAMYSLRSFSRDLEVHPSLLSEVMNHKRSLSQKSAEKLAKKLEFTTDEMQHFLCLVEAENGKSMRKQRIAREKLAKLKANNDYQVLGEEEYQIVADWYHYTILELLYLEDASDDPSWMAKKLGLPLLTIKSALSRLVRVGLLIQKNGVYMPNELFSSFESETPSSAIKTHHEQVLDKAKQALYEQGVDARDFSTIIVATHRKHLPEIKAMIKEFRRKLDSFLSQNQSKNSVYCLAIQFFRLDQDAN